VTSGAYAGSVSNLQEAITDPPPAPAGEPMALAPVPVENAAVTHPAPGAVSPAVPDEPTETAVSAREQRNVGKAFQEMGGNPELLDRAISLRSFSGRHVKSVLGLVMAGLAVNSDRLLQEIGRLQKRLDAGGFKYNEKGDPSEEALVLNSFLNYCKEHRQGAETAQKTLLMLAKIEALQRVGHQRPPPGHRPERYGCTPKAEMIIKAKNVMINPNP